jgi:hypothetical protein
MAEESYDYTDDDACTYSHYGEADIYRCPDSGAIISRRGDVVLSVNTANIREEILSRTEALRRMVGDENVLTNVHFNIVISPEYQAPLVGNQDFEVIASQIRQAADMGAPLPDIQDLIDSLPQTPAKVALQKKLKESYELRNHRLEGLARLTKMDRLSPQQVAAFHNSYVTKSQLIDRALIANTTESLTLAANAINGSIQELMLAEPYSTIYEQVKATGSAILEAHTNQGIFDPEGRVALMPPVERLLTDEDFEKRMLVADRLIKGNELLRTSLGPAYAAAGLPLFNLMVAMADQGRMDHAWRVYEKDESTEFFLENDDASGTRFDVHLNGNAQAMFELDLEPTSSAAYDVTLLLNEVADYHAATGQITIDYQAIIMVNARAALSTADAIRQLYHTEEGYTWYGVVAGFLGGMAETAADSASGIFHMVLHPAQTLEGLKAMIVNWDDTLALIWQQGAEIIHNWPNMTPQEKANFMGQLAVEVLASLPNKVRQAGRVGDAAKDAVRIHMDKAARGLQIIERTGVPLSPKAASELAHLMEELGVTSYDEMVNIIDGLDEYLPCRLTNRTSGSSVGTLAFKVNCPPDMDPKEFKSIKKTLEAQISRRVPEDKHDVTLNGILDGQLKMAAADRWVSPADLQYKTRLDGENSLLHMMRHGEDDLSKPVHGIFNGGREKAPRIVDIAFRKILNNPSDIILVSEETKRSGVYKKYIVDMRSNYSLDDPVGFIGGRSQQNKNPKLKACFMEVIIKDGHILETAYPYRTDIHKCDNDPERQN